MFSVFIDPMLATKSWTDTFVATPKKRKSVFNQKKEEIEFVVRYQLSDRVDLIKLLL